MTRGKFTLLFISYILFLISLFLYSFTQIDLNLTISQNNLLFSFQKIFQGIGYFNRPLSTGIFISLLILFFIFYFLFFILTVKKRITLKQIIILIATTIIILILSYPAFSYDIFNYLFYGRIITHYGLSPYNFRALDFPLDPWTRFMHWTHNTYPYGPFWLVLSAPLSFIGSQKFILTLILYKILMMGGFLLSIYSIYKIAREIKIKNPLLPVVLFAFNPLVIIETLISSHNDIVMIGLSLMGLYYLIKQKFLLSFCLIFISALIKFTTAVLIPVWIIFFILKIKKKPFSPNRIFFFSSCFLILASCFYVKNNILQPWYFLWFSPFILLLNNKYLNIILSFLSLSFLGNYIPYLLLGNWDKPIPFINFLITIIILLVGCLISIIVFLHDRMVKLNNHLGNL